MHKLLTQKTENYTDQLVTIRIGSSDMSLGS